jgi:hypothetical protein
VSYQENEKHEPKKDRYWSVMLVGDRGRVIPFRHFKGIALGVCTVSFLLLVAFVVISLLYIGQGRKLASLEAQLEQTQLQSSKLRDEKDLYLTKLMLAEKKEKTPVAKPTSPEPSKPAASPSKPSATPSETAQTDAAAEETAAPAKPPAPIVAWNVDIRRFSVSYDAKRERLEAQFRVYNTSKPKKRLAGRGVVVFKVQDDPPFKWMPVPLVQLRSGEPTGTRGQSFEVRNYLTMKFSAYHQKTPVTFNMATAFIFSEDGRLLASKDFAFQIKTPPPPVEKPAPPAPPVEKKPPAPASAPTPDSPAVKPLETTVPAAPAPQKSDGSATSSPAPDSGQPGGPALPDAPIPTPEAPKPDGHVDTPPSGAPPAGKADIPVQTDKTPATEPTVQSPQPGAEGEPK